MAAVGRDCWRFSSPTPLFQQGHLNSAAPDGFWVSPRMETPQPPLATCASAQSPLQWKSVSLCSEGASCISVSALCFWPCHWEVPAPSSLHPCFRCLYTLVRHPLGLLFSKMKSLSSLSFSLCNICSSPFIIFVALCWTLSSMSTFLSYWEAPQLEESPVLSKWERTWPVDITCPFSSSLGLVFTKFCYRI